MTDLDSVRTDEAEDDEEPDVGEEREDHGDNEDWVGLDPPDDRVVYSRSDLKASVLIMCC